MSSGRCRVAAKAAGRAAALTLLALCARDARALTLDRAVVVLNARRGDGFVVKGRFTPSQLTGVDAVALTFGGFADTVPISRFASRHGRLVFVRSRRQAGLRSLVLDGTKGRFIAVAKDIAWDRSADPSPLHLVAGAVDECSTVTFREGARSWTVASTVAACGFASAPTATPSAIVAGTSTAVTVQVAALPGATFDATGVTLVRLGPDSSPTGDPLCTLHDDGDAADGDAVAGDGTFGCRATVLEPEPAHVRVAARAVVGGVVVLSSATTLDVVVPPTDEQIMAAIAGQDAAGAAWDAAFAAHGDSRKARKQALAAIRAQAGVTGADLAPDGSIFITYDGGVGGGLMLDPPGTPGAGDVEGLPSLAPIAPATVPAAARAVRPQATSDGPAVGNEEVLVWAPFYHETLIKRTVDALVAVLQRATCPSLNVTVLKDADCTLDSIATFGGYGTVVMATHGAVLPDRQASFMSGEKATTLSEWVTHRTAIGAEQVFVYRGQRSPDKTGYFVVRPSFVRSSLALSLLPNVVFGGGCSMAENSTLASAFFGAFAFLGFSNTTFGPYIQYTATSFFGQFVQAKTARDAYDAVQYKVTRPWFDTSEYASSQSVRAIVTPQEQASQLVLLGSDTRVHYECTPPMPGVVETITVSATPGSHAVGTKAFEAGVHYKLKISGTGEERLDPDFHDYDAFYCFASSSPSSPCADPNGFPIDSPIALGIQVGDTTPGVETPQDFTGHGPGPYSASNAYQLEFSTGAGGRLYVTTVPSSCGGCTYSGSFSVEIDRE